MGVKICGGARVLVTTRTEDLREVGVVPRMFTDSIRTSGQTLPAAGTGREGEGKGEEETVEETPGSLHPADLREVEE